MALNQWSTTPINNATAATNINWAEGQLPSTVNDSARQMMADVATWWQAAEWLNLGDALTYMSGTQFSVPTNRTSVYTVGRRVRATVTAGTIYGTITASAYGSVTNVTVSWDSGALDSGLSEVDVGIMNPAHPSSYISGLVGSARNLTMRVDSASSSATITADEIIVEGKLGAPRFCIANFSQAVNLSTTGAGGMDTGSAPVSGYVGIYALYNPITGSATAIAVNATSSSLPNVYSGGNAPSGYTASALISVWPTDSSSRFIVGFQRGRKITLTPLVILTTTVSNVSGVLLSISNAVPPNATSVDVQGGMSNITSGLHSAALYVMSTSAQVGYTELIGTGGNNTSLTSISGNAPGIPIVTSQTIYYSTQGDGGTLISFSLLRNAYTF